MIEYIIIGCIAMLQYLGYLIIDRKEIRFPKWLLLILLLLGQLFVFPQLIIWGYGLGGNECGMPILALHLFFLLLGGSLNIVTHFLYYFKYRSKKIA